jgi:hypothetical protein
MTTLKLEPHEREVWEAYVAKCIREVGCPREQAELIADQFIVEARRIGERVFGRDGRKRGRKALPS